MSKRQDEPVRHTRQDRYSQLLAVRLEGVQANAAAIGAVITLH